MVWFLAALAAIGFVEALVRLPLLPTVAAIANTAGKASRVIRSSRISDHWKERVLLRYAARVMRGSLLTMVFLVAAFLPVLALNLVGRAFGVHVLETAMTLPGLVFMTVVGLIYAKRRAAYVRKKL